MLINQPKKKKNIQRFFLTFSVVLIVSGLWFSTTSTATFVKGYLLYKTGNVEATDFSSKPESLFVAYSDKHTSKETTHSEYPETPEIGDLMGELIIPKLEATLPIIHGTDEDELEQGVGHFAQSVMPGENDNSVLSGHRDTVFRELGDVGKGDLLIVETYSGTFTYKVRQVRIVDEDDRTVIVPKPRATLIVSTCYPFDYVGYAPDRYILVADLVSSN
ncbi:class D sortase [Planococcus sp. S3-L1]|uniref:class D sortase n=1 Tax=Planococcus sp. S3-L1 TaxID=3046200 RepID=UPI0024B90572|nr:class D sortase [Planococcus sp. S3-L1]MDJ0330488.1 class D sortase [Planococcus sp. S3-L1]